MKKSNLLKKAVSVLLVASALAGCGSSATQTATTAAPAASGTETSAAATEAGSTGSTAESGTITMAMVSAWDSIVPFDTTSSYSDVVLDLIDVYKRQMLVSIPPKISVSSFMGYLKGKSALMIFDKHANLKYKFGNRHFWAEGYYVSTVGLNEATIKRCV